MAKRTTTSTGAVKRTRKTTTRTRTPRRTVARPVAAAPAAETAAAAGTARVAPEPTTEQIAERAYYLSLERKGPGGPLDDWLQAERELRNGSIPA